MGRNCSIDRTVITALSFARSLVGTPYRWWNGGDLRGDHGPFWSQNGAPPKCSVIRSQSCGCAGLINLIRRRVALPIPGLERAQYPFAGGTASWSYYLKKKEVLLPFNHLAQYPKGTLLIRPYRNAIDQGHLAVVYSEHSQGILFAQLIHSYALDPHPRPDRIVAGGVLLDKAVGSSHFWSPRGYFTHVCLPEDWLR